jgi:hypothetical protein
MEPKSSEMRFEDFYAFSRTAAAKKWPFRGSLVQSVGSSRRDGIPWRSWRFRERSFFKPIDDASDASFDEGNVEVDEPPQALVGELPIR